jgi:hypothetical protein
VEQIDVAFSEPTSAGRSPIWCFTARPTHERAVRGIVESSGVGLRLELPREVWSQAREYERGVLTAIRRFGAKPDKKIVDRQAASPSSWKTPFMAAWMAS